eukprot:TRINITY_DN2161_c0_g1_i2.p2 TRINITY_DN2161_c0_g1~~TRINITY_DN2161_c0_g1_i2.p2  ORF type:complete len:128 (-),score=31.32 TRINITY_DN2161_c0_g1_i2:366-749(-)
MHIQEAKLGPVEDDLPADGMLESFGDKLTAKAERIREKRARKEARRKARLARDTGTRGKGTGNTSDTATTAIDIDTVNGAMRDQNGGSCPPPSQRVDSFLAQFASGQKRDRTGDKLGRKDKKKKKRQ